MNDGSQGVAHVPMPARPAEVRHEDRSSAGGAQMVQGRQRFSNSVVVGDLPG